MRFSIVFLLLCFLYNTCNAATLEQIVIANAVQEIGHGEEGGDNRGKYVRQYTQGREVAWCAGFVSFVLKKSGVDTFGYQLSARKFFTIAQQKGLVIKNPVPGCLAVFWRGKRSGPLGHVVIVERVDREYFYTIEGNSGDFPAKVKRKKYKKIAVDNLLGFVKITAR